MGTSSKDTIFQSDSGAGQSANDYLKDSFQDISLPANTNSTFTSTAATNPTSQFFFNTDAPQYSYKTLYISNMELLEDRTKWINNKPTYQVFFDEDFPGVFAYCFGDCKLKNFSFGKSIEIRNIDDGFGIGGIVRRVGWLLNPTNQASATADIVVDGADSGNDADWSAAPVFGTTTGYNKQYVVHHATSNATKDIHDICLTANQYGNMVISGIVVYFENATTDIDMFPGSTYVDKDKKTTTSLTTKALATISGRRGGKSLLYKDSSNTYQQVTVEPISVESVGTGTINTNLISVTTGTGASFPAGTGVVSISSGTSFYVGSVLSVSTDTLTMSQTLAFGISGPLFKAWWAGPTIGINASLYALSYQFDPAQSSVDIGSTLGFATSQDGALFFSDPFKRYRVWGNNLKTVELDGYFGVGFTGTAGFMQVDSSAAAVEIEFAGNGTLNATFSINGCAAWNINEGFTGIAKKTVFTDAGPGWNSFYFSTGSNNAGYIVNKINFYELAPDASQTLGRLACYDTYGVTPILRGTADNATLIPLGMHRRYFADDFYYKGDWGRGFTTTMAGGVFMAGSSSNSVLSFNYYGKDFGIVGTAGTTVTMTLDGASINSSFNTVKSVASEGFHSVTVNAQNGTTTLVAAIDVFRSRGEMTNLQAYLPLADQDQSPTIFQQGNTPANPKPGDIWAQDRDTGFVWIYLFDRWNRFNISSVIDNPNASFQFVKSHGTSSGTTGTTAQLTSEHFNFISWYTGVSAGTASGEMETGECAYNSRLHAISGVSTGDAVQAYHQAYDKVAWITLTNSSLNRQGGSIGAFIGSLYYGQGSTNTSHTGGDQAWERFNNGSWVSVGNSVGAGRTVRGTWISEGLMHVSGGTSAAGAASADHDIYNGTAFLASTVQPAGKAIGASSRANVAGSVGGFVGWGGNSNGAYTWNGAVWASPSGRVFNADASENAGAFSGFHPVTNKSYYNGGTDTGAATTSVTRTDTFNGLSFASDVASATARAGGAGGIF